MQSVYGIDVRMCSIRNGCLTKCNVSMISINSVYFHDEGVLEFLCFDIQHKHVVVQFFVAFLFLFNIEIGKMTLNICFTKSHLLAYPNTSDKRRRGQENEPKQLQEKPYHRHNTGGTE
jgi:hypothetical protein